MSGNMSFMKQKIETLSVPSAPHSETMAEDMVPFTDTPKTLNAMLDRAAHRSSSFLFYDGRGQLIESYSHKQLRADAIRTAHHMIAKGVKPGDRIGIIAKTSPEFLTLFFAATYSGAWPTPLPLPSSFSGESYAAHLAIQSRNYDPTMLFGPGDIIELLRNASETKFLPLIDWQEFLHVQAPEAALPVPDPNATGYIQYSSGSTCFPRGIMISHVALLNNLKITCARLRINTKNDVVVSWLPWYHDMGLVGLLLSTLFSPTDSHFINTSDFARRPLTWLDIISRIEKNTVSFSPSFGYDICARRAPAREAVAERFDLSRWRVAGNGADMIRVDIMQRFIDVFAHVGFKPTSFVPSYGLAETTLAVSTMPIDHGVRFDLIEESMLSGRNRKTNEPQRYRSVVNCGKILDGIKIEIRDESGAILPDRVIGKIWCNGPTLMSGYYQNPGDTAVCLVDGWLDTGDMGYLSQDHIYVVGRYKDMILLNGRNYWPQDIEWAAERNARVKGGDIAAFAITTAGGEECPVVLVQCRVTSDEERKKLVMDIKDTVCTATGLICQILLIPPRTLPLTSSGKISRSKARTQYLSGTIQPYSI